MGEVGHRGGRHKSIKSQRSRKRKRHEKREGGGLIQTHTVNEEAGKTQFSYSS